MSETSSAEDTVVGRGKGLSVGDGIELRTAHWTFGDEVPKVFVDHVRRSVPFYDALHDLVCEVSDFFCQPGGVSYELGVSTGQLMRKLACHHHDRPGIRWVGIDVEAAMVTTAAAHCADAPGVELVCGDITTFPYEKADFMVAFLTLPFLERETRAALVRTIYASLKSGGAFFMYERVRAPDARLQDIATTMYWHFKRNNGFTEEEIIHKSDSLTGIMDPQTSLENRIMLQDAGFRSVMSMGGYVCFEAVLAIK